MIANPATDLLGTWKVFSPAFFASAVMAAGVMSGEPTICSSLRLSRTVLASVDAHDDCGDAERDEDCRGDDSTDFENLAHLNAPFRRGRACRFEL